MTNEQREFFITHWKKVNNTFFKIHSVNWCELSELLKLAPEDNNMLYSENCTLDDIKSVLRGYDLEVTKNPEYGDYQIIKTTSKHLKSGLCEEDLFNIYHQFFLDYKFDSEDMLEVYIREY